MTKIKICGLKREEDILFVNEYRPDFIGFVFAKSKRQIGFDTAKKLKNILNENIKSVGVFVNDTIENIRELCENKIIDLIQLHGNESSSYIFELRKKISIPIIKAVAVAENFTIPDLDVNYFLFDTLNKENFGGTGKSFDWNKIKNFKQPYFLAGGLNSTNIEIAIKKIKPFCIDISSGVETNEIKDKNKINEVMRILKRLS
jgi:phosphoribosylanthranilate isomerase